MNILGLISQLISIKTLRLTETIVHRFGLRHSISVDNGMNFNGLRFWLLHKSMTLKSLTLHHTMHKQMGKQNLPTRSSKPI